MDASADPLIPLARWLNEAVAQLGAGSGLGLDGTAAAVTRVCEAVQTGLGLLPTGVLVGLFAALGWWRRGWRLGGFAAVALLLVFGLGFGPAPRTTLAQVLTATAATLALGVPLGILLGRHPRLARAARPLLDFMQTMPAFVYLIPATMLFGLGLAPALLATVIFSLPPVTRLTAMGIQQVGRDVVEAAGTLGATRWQVLTRVQLPNALPSILLGISQSIMMALSMVIIASMVGAGGLGNEVLSSIQRLDIGQGLASGLSIVLLAIVIDRLAESFAPAVLQGPAR